MKKTKIKLIFGLALFLVIFFTGVNILASYLTIKKTIEESIAVHNVETAKSIAASMDIELYKKFLENPVKGKEYHAINEYFNDAKEKIGALHLYSLAVDNPKVSRVMVPGMLKSDNIEIGLECTVPEKQVSLAYEGETYYTGVINDPVYGQYLSVGVPIIDNQNEIIGFLGIDISTQVLNNIGDDVIKNNSYMLIFNGLFVVVLLLSFLIIEKWYQKELKKEVGETEVTYQSEFRSLISSVQSLRHDFSNHIQVIHGLLKLGNHEQALEYLTYLFKEVHAIENIKLNVNNPGLSVLIETKRITANNHSIEIAFDICDDSFSKIKSTDLIKIMSNLIDNAIEATIELPESDRRIKVACKVSNSQYFFEVTNTGHDVDEKVIDNIFERGFSTKKEKAGKIRGQGLFIVKEIVKRYDGQIKFHVLDREIVVTCNIPKS
ncbi:sensor histidine kinase [Peribacillus huizhouensis]|uniref:Sensor histidine kinase regulating citrate/malate metabolism n=1 Tax=Peribacillus huizhouensis TaxID=1501239 RepID=A0ABR6CSM6_9BACI|nr:GHKL domain-containing protein [Peribacillus huizhouensis]MBA9028013.1 sensor histidine kinase regulating citrate/malate metabolism [Peribacillus huizhouensis]